MFKKLISMLVVVTFALFCAQPVLAAPRGDGKQQGWLVWGSTGNALGDLDSLDISGSSAPNQYDLEEGNYAIYVSISGTVGTWDMYVFDASGTDATSWPETVRPNDYNGTTLIGVWRRTAAGTLHALLGTTQGDLDFGTFTGSTLTDNQTAKQLFQEIETALEAISGDITSVLDDATGTVPILYQSWTAFTASDATPDVSAAQHFRTANSAATTITDFDGSMLSDGRMLRVFVNDSNTTIDFTSSGIEAANRTTDLAVDVETVLEFVYSTTDNQWHCINAPDETATVSTNGLIARTAANTAAARTITAGTVGVDVGDGDGVSGNPTISLDVTPSAGSATLEEADDALQVKYDATLTESASGLGIATDGVDSQHYNTGSIDTEHIAADQITNALIADDQIDSEHYVAVSIDNEHLADDAADSDEIASNAIDDDHLNTTDGINIVLDGGGSALTDGTMICVEIPFACTITESRLLADQSGSVTVDWWKDTYANHPPTNADSITASATPAISTDTKDSDTTLTGWTTSITAEDVLCAVVEGAATTITQVTAVLKVTR